MMSRLLKDSRYRHLERPTGAWRSCKHWRLPRRVAPRNDDFRLFQQPARRLLLLLILLSSVANAAVRFDGNSHFADKLLLELVRQASTIEQRVAAIDSAYVAAGYFLVTSDFGVTGIDTSFTITERQHFCVADLHVGGLADTIAAEVAARYDKSDPLTHEQLERIAQDIVRTFADNGYPFAQAEMDEITVSDSVVTVQYRVVSGPQVAVGRVSFPGLKTTKPEPLRKRIDLKSGGIYRETDLLATSKKLSQLRHCYPAGAASLAYESRSSTVDISLPLRDERNLAFEGFAYLTPDNSVAGQVNVNLMNPLGRGEELGVFWSRQNEISSKLNFNLLFPYVADYPLDVSARLSQEDRDSSFIGTTAQMAGVYHLGDDWSVGAGFRWDRITPEENRATSSARALAVDLSTEFDHRDDIRQTRQGTYFTQHLVSAYRKSFATGGGVASGYSTNLEGELRLWQPVCGKLVVFQCTRYFQITSDFAPIPVDQLIGIGGNGSLRGYRENSFLAHLGAVSSTELRWYAAGNLMLHLFSDNGYIETSAANQRLSGFGAGLAVTTTAGTFRFELALGEEKKINRVLVHLGLEGKL
jgi:outer membrane protein assembly factor BamA